MDKYFVSMKNNRTKKEVHASGWKVAALNDWISFHESKGYIVTSKNF